MAVYMFTYHAYRTWGPDNPRGFVRSADEGILPPDKELAHLYDQRASQSPVLFGRLHQEVLIWTAYDVCQRRRWRLHYAATEPTHLHVLLSWQGFQDWKQASDRVKNVSSLMLGRATGQSGRRWFVRNSSRKRVRNQRHFDYLVNTYLPRHSGLKWREGHPPPPKPPCLP